MSRMFTTLQDVAEERHRQLDLWGEQNHEQGIWLGILGEEFGEVSKEIAESQARALDVEALRAELIQTAAVAVAWVEALDAGASPAVCPSGGSRTPESPLEPLLRALAAVHDDLATVTERMDTDPGAAHEALELIRVTLRQLLDEHGVHPGAWN